MEEGGDGEISLSSNYNSKDHLATGKGLMAKENVKHNKQWLVCGFNGFGQFQFHKRKLQQFEEFEIPCTDENMSPIVASSWSYLAISYDCTLQLQGFLNNTSEMVRTLKTDYPIKALALCDKHCLVLLENGKLYKLLPDCNEELEELTFQTNLSELIPQKRSVFGDCKSARSPLKIDYVACGNNITVAVSECNMIFSGTTQIHKLPKHVRPKQLQCGYEHAVLLTSNGDIFTWGNGLRGQLGLEVLRVEETPTLVEALAGIKITYIGAGGWHSAAISAFGDLYTWGFNSNGQLGLRLNKSQNHTLKEPTVYPLPQLINLPPCQCHDVTKSAGRYFTQTCSPLKVIAGGRHTILLMTCGTIFATGWNFYGQLGLKTVEQYCDNFKNILKLEKNQQKDIQIMCGNWCTLIRK